MTPAEVSAIPVTTGFTWTSGLVALLNVLVGGALVAWVKLRPKMRELDLSAEEKLRADLNQMRLDLKEENIKLEQRLERERRAADRQIALQRHEIGNLKGCLDMLLALIEQDPLKAKEAATRVRALRAEQMKAEAAEKGAARAEPPVFVTTTEVKS